MDEVITPADPVVVVPEVKEEKTEETVDPILTSLSDDTETPEVTESPDDKVEDVKEDETTTDSKTEEEPPEGGEVIDPEEARKEEARARYEEREQVRQERQTRVTQQTQEYIDEAETELEKSVREIQSSEYGRIIEATEDKLISEHERVTANPELQMFNPDSESFNQKLYDKAMGDFNRGYIQYDTNGNMVGLKGSLYQHLTETAELYQGATKKGAFQQVRDQRKMKTNADSKQAVSPKEETKDPILEILKSD